MADLSELETLTSEFSSAAKALADQYRNAGAGSSVSLTQDEMPDVSRTRRNLLAILALLQTLLSQPTDFLQNLASHTQLLSCLQWLGEFQVLAYIPLGSSVPIKDVADLADVPEMQLSRVVRMMATAGFLRESEPGHVAHTALSSSFVTRPSHLDAAKFLAETAALTALRMASATKLRGQSDSTSESAYSVAFNTSQTFPVACEKQSKFKRQWPAYLRYVGDVGGVDDGESELLGRLDWLSLGNACIVDVGATSTASVMALAEIYPALHFVVQISEADMIVDKADVNNSRIIVQKRANGAPQPVKDAAAYIIRVTSSLAGHLGSMPLPGLRAWLLAELRAHLDVFRKNMSATLILVIRLLPEPGTSDPYLETLARMRDLSLSQLANGGDLEMGELNDLVDSVQDGNGRLVVVNKLRSRNNALVALAVKYKAHA